MKTVFNRGKIIVKIRGCNFSYRQIKYYLLLYLDDKYCF